MANPGLTTDKVVEKGKRKKTKNIDNKKFYSDKKGVHFPDTLIPVFQSIFLNCFNTLNGNLALLGPYAILIHAILCSIFCK